MATFQFDGWWDHIMAHQLGLTPGSDAEKAAKVIARAVWTAAQTAARTCSKAGCDKPPMRDSDRCVDHAEA